MLGSGDREELKRARTGCRELWVIMGSAKGAEAILQLTVAWRNSSQIDLKMYAHQYACHVLESHPVEGLRNELGES
jgi:hypothetical protein